MSMSNFTTYGPPGFSGLGAFTRKKSLCFWADVISSNQVKSRASNSRTSLLGTIWIELLLHLDSSCLHCLYLVG